jgi:hypothetical protein
MNGSFLAAGASLLAVLLWWGSRRRPPALLPSTDAHAVAALNRAQIALVQQEATAGRSPGAPERRAPALLPRRGDARQGRQFLEQLRSQLAGDRHDRLAAMQQARLWGDRSTLPLLHRGLRDVDPAVCHEACLAMDRFRGRTAAAQLTAPPLRPNVARTR